MNSNEIKTMALVGCVACSLSLFQASATNITLGPGTTPVTTSTNQFIGIGDSNIFDGTQPQLALGNYNEFKANSNGALIGWYNILGEGAHGSLLAGEENQLNTPYSAVFGYQNSLNQSAMSWNVGNIVAGSGNELDAFLTSAIFGASNRLIYVGLEGHAGSSSLLAGFDNELSTGMGWVIGSSNEASGDISTTVGLGLLNPGFAAVVIGSYNQEMEGSSVEHEEDGAAFIVGNGEDDEGRSNAIETLKNGETTLINKAWNPVAPLVVPAAADSAEGRALVVDGHTLLKGQVIIAEPQGDISMGDYAE